MIYFDDIQPGMRLIEGPHPIDLDELRDFALKWDPLPQHVDLSRPGGITAPGLYMFAVKMALIRKMKSGFAVIASLGYDEVRFPNPMRPGDMVTMEIEVANARASTNKPDRGIASLRVQLSNQAGLVCLSHLDTILVLRRNQSA